jgi:hypothetical protein
VAAARRTTAGAWSGSCAARPRRGTERTSSAATRSERRILRTPRPPAGVRSGSGRRHRLSRGLSTDADRGTMSRWHRRARPARGRALAPPPRQPHGSRAPRSRIPPRISTHRHATAAGARALAPASRYSWCSFVLHRAAVL